MWMDYNNGLVFRVMMFLLPFLIINGKADTCGKK
jgi:hypothetical protein